MAANDSELAPRQQVLRAVQRSSDPVGVAELAEQVGVHQNTVRFHLDGLVGEGSIEATSAKRSGPGRPRTVYRARPGLARGGERRYHLLAEILLSRLAADSADGADGADPGAAATETGRAWGAHLVDRPAPAQRLDRAAATARLLGLLDELGFAPESVPEAEAAPEQVRLRHCPFLELAEKHRDIVCPLHLGLMQGALGELRAPVRATKLEPFAETDACLAHLTP